MARAFSLRPELLAGTAEEGHVAGAHRLVEGLAIHVAHHQHSARHCVLHHSGDQSALLIEIRKLAHLVFFAACNEKARHQGGLVIHLNRSRNRDTPSNAPISGGNGDDGGAGSSNRSITTEKMALPSE